VSAALTRARKLLQPRQRRKSGRFLAEGHHVLVEALSAGLRPVDAFVSRDTATDDALSLLDAMDAPVHDVAPRELAEIAGTRTPQGVVVVFEQPESGADPFARPGLWLLLDRVQDPGNAGTLLRAAEAFGARGALALPGTVDLWSPKTVRAGQGAHFHLDLLEADVADHVAQLRDAGGEIWAAETGGDDVYDLPTAPPLCALAVGNEAGGLAPDVLALADRRVAVPQRGRTESLNVAMAGTVLLSWMSRGAAAR
jgi:TrmH family RNA methyltransferase